MGRRDDEEKQAEASAARDFVMARLLAAGASLKTAQAALDDAAALFLDPSGDVSGKERKKLLETLDAACGDAAASTQLAMAELPQIDPQEEDPEPGDEEEEDEDEDETDDTEDRPARRRSR